MERGKPPLLCGPILDADFRRFRRTRGPNFVFPDADMIGDPRRPGPNRKAQHQPAGRGTYIEAVEAILGKKESY